MLLKPSSTLQTAPMNGGRSVQFAWSGQARPPVSQPSLVWLGCHAWGGLAWPDHANCTDLPPSIGAVCRVEGGFSSILEALLPPPLPLITSKKDTINENTCKQCRFWGGDRRCLHGAPARRANSADHPPIIGTVCMYSHSFCRFSL